MEIENIKYSLGDFGVKFMFTQLRPGSEKMVVEKFQSLTPSRLYKSLGKFDLAVISDFQEADDIRIDRRILNLTHHFLQINHTLCYSWEQPVSQPIASPYFDEPLLALCFLKFEPNFSAEFGNDLIERTISYLFPKEDSCSLASGKYALYGGLGWNELVLLFFGDNFPKMLNDIVPIGALTLEDLEFFSEIAKENTSVFLNTFTIPMIKYGSIASSDELLFSEYMPEEILELVLLVSARVGSHGTIAQKLMDYFQTKPSAMFGKDDLIIKKRISLSDFINKLIKFRKEMRKELFSTSTLFTIPWPSKGKNVETFKAASEEHEKIEIAPYISEINDGALSKSLMDMFCAFNIASSDEMIRDCFIDMVPLLKRLAVNKNNEFDKNDVNRLWNIVNVVTKGFRQRFMGSYSTVYNITELMLAYQGGIQRILLAADFLPHAIMSGHEYDWDGFVVFGLRDEYHCHDLGIINLPYTCLFDPSTWWGIFHEVGHEYASYRQITERDEFRDVLTQHIGISNIEEPTQEDKKEITMAWEHYADIFDFIYGFRGDWDLYFNTVFPYVIEKSPKKAAGYFTRSLIVYLYHISKTPSKMIELLESQQRFKAVVEELYHQSKQICEAKNLRLMISDISFDIIQNLQFYCYRWLPFVALVLQDLEPVASLADELKKIKSDDILLNLKQGYVLKDIKDPIGILS